MKWLKTLLTLGVLCLLVSLPVSHVKAKNLIAPMYGYTRVTYPVNPSPVLGQAFHFSAAAQATYRTGSGTAVDPEYERNVKVFWAWVSPAGKNLNTLNQMDLTSFEGILEIPAGITMDSESIYGPYGSSSGMRNILIGNGIMGGGACNTNGMLAHTLWYAGFEVTVTCLGHPAQPGVDSRFWATVQSGSGCTILAKNMSGQTQYLHWKISGDDIQLWVDNIATTSTGEVPTASVSAQVAPETYSELMTDQTVFGVLPVSAGFQPIVLTPTPTAPAAVEPHPTSTSEGSKPDILVLVILLGAIFLLSQFLRQPTSKS